LVWTTRRRARKRLLPTRPDAVLTAVGATVAAP